MGGRYGRTDFSGFTQAQLVQMLAAGRTTDVQAAADGWRDLANALDDMALTIEREDANFRGLWQGPSAAEHAAMIASLVDGIRQVAFCARSVGSQVSTAREALGQAQQRMAALGPPPTVAPLNQATIALASAPLPYGRPELPVVAAQQAAAIRAVQDYQRAQASATALNAAAAAILSDLRDQYGNLNFPTLPQVANPPTIAPDGSPIFSARTAAGAGTAASRPLFSDLWGDGLAAAAGLPPAQVLAPYQAVAAGGAGQPLSGGALAGSGVGGGLGSLGSSALGAAGAGVGLGSLGSSAVGAAGSLGALGAPSLDPSAVPSAVGQSSLAPTIDPASAAGRATGTAAVPGFLGGGFSPLGGAGGLGGGIGGGGVAAWLVGEVEEFGVKATVVPGLID